MYPNIHRLVDVVGVEPDKSYFKVRIRNPDPGEHPVLEVPKRQVRFRCDEEGVIHARLLGEGAPLRGESVWISFEGTTLIGWGTTELFTEALRWAELEPEERRLALGLDPDPQDGPRRLCA